jgi:phosphoglycerate dehydrogenase-like enzyme
MKVLVADKFEQSGIDGLKSAGCEVVYEPDLKDDRLKEAIRATSAEVLVVRGTMVTAPMLDAGRLALIVRAGAGYNTIDVAAASTRGTHQESESRNGVNAKIAVQACGSPAARRKLSKPAIRSSDAANANSLV